MNCGGKCGEGLARVSKLASIYFNVIGSLIFIHYITNHCNFVTIYPTLYIAKGYIF